MFQSNTTKTQDSPFRCEDCIPQRRIKGDDLYETTGGIRCRKGRISLQAQQEHIWTKTSYVSIK
jgi:hypothetical protein